MLGNCVFRNPIMKNGKLDKGALCEALLFFSKAHLVIDMATLGTMVDAGFLDDLILMLKAGLLTGNYSPQAPVLHTNNVGGLREHLFTVIKISGDPGRPNMRNPELLESQLGRTLKDKGAARKYYRALADLISFEDVGDNGVPQMGRQDICDPYIAAEAIRLALLSKGIPANEIKLSRIQTIPLDENKFVIVTDIDFDRLRPFLPEDDRAGFSQNDLLPIISDARWDIGIAASQNAALIGNERNKTITEMMLQRSLGAKFDSELPRRQIYDLISVATPGVREVINNGDRTPKDFVRLMEKAGAFQSWLKEQNPTADLVQEMLREKTRSDWLDALPIKAVRFALFTGGGLLADMFAPGSSLATSAADTFLVDRFANRWRPHYFVENHLRGFLEK